MASYTIQRAGSTSSAGRQAAITLLPDDLLAYAFSWLDFQERQRVLPLVCKRWEQVAHFPSLLDSVKVCIETEYMCDGELLLPPLRCFCRWLERRAAGSVQRLDISLDSPTGLGGTAFGPKLAAAAAVPGGQRGGGGGTLRRPRAAELRP
ncbi:hypothetical protein CHLNCDRAFT_143687 [Chlorella variabilis]|uniref:F-box domain-containing protein n=1 Tax=Chlorella variabilis TaxID=554065 RepID=E1ZA91_CHLVA|nr:hypothetical protein CHLNCDRAFT_143687 [Chlorella variabilis]EFN57018.1 hypothetical protein CHLNCDRAFT_143687 [Chlorella variabilis]|eukprot:XP_005849120.1 hypothetical protein CHLNCDRAFT_143687 [Chlorella variabilis]